MNQEIVFANQALCNTFEYEAFELVGQNISILLHTKHHAKHLTFVDSFFTAPSQKYSMYSGNIVIGKKKNGKEVLIQAQLSFVESDNQKYALASITNIIEADREKYETQNSVRRMQRIIEASNDGLWEWEITSNKVWYSPKFMQIIGEDPLKEHSFDLWLNHIAPDEQEDVKNQLKQNVRCCSPYNIVYKGKTSNGSYEWMQIRGTVTSDKSGNAKLMSGTIRNIEDTMALRDEVERKTQNLNSVLEKSLCAVHLYDLITHKNVFINNQFTLITGYTLNDLNKLQEKDNLFASLYHPEDLDRFIRHITSVSNDQKNSGIAFEYRFKHKDGHWIWCYSKDSLLDRKSDGTPSIMLSSFFDITEIKYREQEYSRLARSFHSIFEQAAVGIAKVALNGTFLKVNSKLSSILGFKENEFKKINFLDLLLKKDRTTLSTKLKKVKSKNISQLSIEIRCVRSDDKRIWTNLSVSLVNEPISNSSHFIFILEDIDHKKSMESRLEESNQALERFAYSASHDLQEPLRKICAFSDTLMSKLSNTLEDEDSLFELENINKASKRMSDMIKSLLQLSKLNFLELSKEKVSLRLLIELAKDDLERIINSSSARITLTDDVDILVDMSNFLIVIRNLISNAIKYTPSNQVPEIEIYSKSAHSFITIHFKDKGCGFEMKYKDLIFEPFKRLVGRSVPGHGMGLALCKKIMKIHGGSISVESEPEKGSCFKLTLPS